MPSAGRAAYQREFPLKWKTVCVIAAGLAITRFALGQTRTVDTAIATLSLSERSGDLIGVHWKHPEMEIIQEPRLGENFRILVPAKGYEANYFNSRDQAVSHIEATPNEVICTYDSLRNERETLPIKVLYRVRVVGEQIQFSVEVNNSTERKLAVVM
jgi:hypothetical protein